MLDAVPAPPSPVAVYLAAHPRYAVLPTPYFEPATADANYLDLDLKPASFLGHGRPWSIEIEANGTTRIPARGSSTAGSCSAFLPLGPQSPHTVVVKLFTYEQGERKLAARFPLAVRPRRFAALYTRGPFAKQVSTRWGEDGCALVLIQRHYPASFTALRHPVLYVGGDFNYQRIEGLVRYFRTHGVNAFGYKPDYDRNADESLLAMGKADRVDAKQWLALAAGGAPAHVVGLCLGGLHSRAMKYAEQGLAGPSMFASLSTVGTPHQGSALADIYNAVPALPMLHRWVTGDGRIHRYKDARIEMRAFNQQVGLQIGVPTRCIVLDATGRTLDPRYALTAPPLQWLQARETASDPRSVHTDGLILSDGQALGTPFATWQTDHAGMINDGLASTYFDAYAAHQALLRALEPTESRL
jgi:hypothetical protein